MSNVRILGLSAAGFALAAVLGGFAAANDGGTDGTGCPASAVAARDGAAARFAAVDTDHDGALSRAEVAAAMPSLGGSFDAMDLDRDGKLSVGELHRPAAAAAPSAGAPRGPTGFEGKLTRI